jgi:hypothetical protein
MSSSGASRSTSPWLSQQRPRLWQISALTCSFSALASRLQVGDLSFTKSAHDAHPRSSRDGGNWLRLKGVDYDAITSQSTQDDYSVGETYDLQEFYLFLAILVASPALVFFSLFLHHPSP